MILIKGFFKCSLLIFTNTVDLVKTPRQDRDESSWGESVEQENTYLTENEYPIDSMLSKLKGQQHVFGWLYHNYAIMLIYGNVTALEKIAFLC